VLLGHFTIEYWVSLEDKKGAALGCHPPLLPSDSSSWASPCSSQPALTLAMVPFFVSGPAPPLWDSPWAPGDSSQRRLVHAGVWRALQGGMLCVLCGPSWVVSGQTHGCIHAVWWGWADNG